jgi:fructose-1,6-bisphosphatase/inositol monophosphatase family enzyme
MPLDVPLQPRVRHRDVASAALLLRAAGVAYADSRGDSDEVLMRLELEAAARLFVAALGDNAVVAGPPATLRNDEVADDT